MILYGIWVLFMSFLLFGVMASFTGISKAPFCAWQNELVRLPLARSSQHGSVW